MSNDLQGYAKGYVEGVEWCLDNSIAGAGSPDTGRLGQDYFEDQLSETYQLHLSTCPSATKISADEWPVIRDELDRKYNDCLQRLDETFGQGHK